MLQFQRSANQHWRYYHAERGSQCTPSPITVGHDSQYTPSHTIVNITRNTWLHSKNPFSEHLILCRVTPMSLGKRNLNDRSRSSRVQGKVGTSPMQVAVSSNPEHNEGGVMGSFIGRATIMSWIRRARSSADAVTAYGRGHNGPAPGCGIARRWRDSAHVK